MTYRVSWEIDIDDTGSPTEAARKAHEIVRRPGSSANVYAVEAPNGVVTTVDLQEAGVSPVAHRSPGLRDVLDRAECFIAGFEGDPLQDGVDKLLADIRAALQGRSDRQVVDETNKLARYLMNELVGTGYQVPEHWIFYEGTDPRSRKAWTSAVAIMEMLTFTNADDALSDLDTNSPGSKPRDRNPRLPLEHWREAVAAGGTRQGYEDWLETMRNESVAPGSNGFEGDGFTTRRYLEEAAARAGWDSYTLLRLVAGFVERQGKAPALIAELRRLADED